MTTQFKSSITEIIRSRISVRTYTNDPIPETMIAQIMEIMDQLENPFKIKVVFSLLTSKDPSIQFGTYGVIQGATHFIGTSVPDTEYAMEALGYAFETLILHLTSLGLGTCWLGGTFDRNRFSEAMDIEGNQLFPAITPFGFASDKKSIADSMFRRLSKGDSRKPWHELFFKQDFKTLLSDSDAGEFKTPLEMLRLAPSASNKQPWRVVKSGDMFHFYEAKTPGYSQTFSYDIQLIDIGIALSHFMHTVHAMGIEGNLEFLKEPISDVPPNVFYRFTWSKS